MIILGFFLDPTSIESTDARSAGGVLSIDSRRHFITFAHAVYGTGGGLVSWLVAEVVEWRGGARVVG